jgi:sucrose phosphorylase
VLYTFYKEDTVVISRWAAEMRNPSDAATFFNILDTHDGVGLMGVKEILPDEEIRFLIESATARGAYVSYKMTEGGTEEPYEINTTWWSAVNGDHDEEDMAFQVKRYLASRSIALVLQGVPGLYTHGAIGSMNDHDLVKKTNVKRDVNRASIDVQKLREEAKDPRSKVSRLARQWPRLSLTRTAERAFHPYGDQKVLMLSPQVFTVVRTSPEGDERILTLTNVADKKVELEIPLSQFGIEADHWVDLVNEREYDTASGKLFVTLETYDVVWMKEERISS